MAEPTPQQQRRARTRQAILDGALALVESEGTDAWSMRELSRRLGFTPGAIYRYFDGKAALVQTLIDDALTQLGRRMTAARDGNESVLGEPGPGEPGLGELGRIAEAYIGFARDQPTLFRLTFVDRSSSRRSTGEPPAATSPYAILLDAVGRALDRGVLHASHDFGAEEMAYTIWAAVHGIATLELTHLRGFEADFESTDREAIGRLLNGLAGPAAGR